MPKISTDNPEPKNLLKRSTTKASPTKTVIPPKVAATPVKGRNEAQKRLDQLKVILGMLAPVPSEWIVAVTADGIKKDAPLEPKLCTNYRDLIMAWRKALKWRQDMDDVLCFMLAIVTSTVQQGDQLFGMVIGDPGCIAGDTPIYDPITRKAFTVSERYRQEKEFHVLAKDEYGVTIKTKALPPIKYPPTQLYEITFSDANKVRVSLNHQLLEKEGYVFVSDLLGDLENLDTYEFPSLGTSIKILSIEKGQVETYYDFLVPTLNNYYANGAFHHNCGKTRFCDGLLVSKHCHALEYLTGFFSGKTDEHGNDYSLISRVNRKCMITPEGDIMMQNPNFVQIMSETRRIFDGTVSATFKTQLEDKRYGGLRTPWIIAGTPSMLEKDHASLGDRFLKMYMESPPQNERREILKRVSRAALEAVATQADGEELVGAKLKEAYQLTGGYINWLRDNTHLLGEIKVAEHHLEHCEYLAEFVAFLRARPTKDDDSINTKEEPNRLGGTFVRLMCCEAMVLNKTEVDDEVMRRIQKGALHTGRGIVLDILTIMRASENQYISCKALAVQMDITEEKIQKVLRFLGKIGGLQLSSSAGVKRSTKPLWGFTPLMRELITYVYHR